MAEENIRSRGAVVRFNEQKGYEFIKLDDGGDDLFVHHTKIKSDSYLTLYEGQTIEFLVELINNKTMLTLPPLTRFAMVAAAAAPVVGLVMALAVAKEGGMVGLEEVVVAIATTIVGCKLLSEEVIDFLKGEMTQQKIKELKQSLNSEFQLIHELCIYVLSASQRTNLIRATLATLHAFLSWIPLLETLLKFLSLLPYQNLTLQCLAELRPLTLEIIIIRSTLICIAYSCYYCRLFSHPL